MPWGVCSALPRGTQLHCLPGSLSTAGPCQATSDFGFHGSIAAATDQYCSAGSKGEQAITGYQVLIVLSKGIKQKWRGEEVKGEEE